MYIVGHPLGKLLGGFQMGGGGCWAPLLQWEVGLGWERLAWLGPNLPHTRNVLRLNKRAPTPLRSNCDL